MVFAQNQDFVGLGWSAENIEEKKKADRRKALKSEE